MSSEATNLMAAFNYEVASEDTFGGTWPFTARYTDAPGFRMHYVDEGEGDLLLALHGEPTWGYLFRNLINTLSKNYRVIAPDHMGFGKSETHQDRNYYLQDHIDNLESFVLEHDFKNITLIMHDFGGPVGMGLAIRHPERIKRIISTNGPTPLGQSNLGELMQSNGSTSPWFSWIASANANDTLEKILGQLDYNILSTLKLNGFERNEIITENWLRAYRTPFNTPESCRGAIGWAKGFAEGTHQFEPVDEVTKKAISRKTSFAIWGMADQTLQPKFFVPLFKEAFPNGKVRQLAGVGHYCLEDAPKEISASIDKFIQET